MSPKLPDPGGVGRIPDGAPTDVERSELFAPGRDTLVIYSPAPPTTTTATTSPRATTQRSATGTALSYPTA
jgi:hypothetical protein